jgi:hypothetical protein
LFDRLRDWDDGDLPPSSGRRDNMDFDLGLGLLPIADPLLPELMQETDNKVREMASPFEGGATLRQETDNKVRE